MVGDGQAERPHIIHLDDDELILNVSRSILLAGGFDITTTRDPAELLDLHERTFDLVIIDLLLPNMDGFTVCQSLRREGWDGPMLAVTAKLLAGHERRMLEEMRVEHLLKPFGPHQFLSRVRMCLSAKA